MRSAMMLNSLCLSFFLWAIILKASYSYPSSSPPSGPDYLDRVDIYKDKITLSGFSSGGTFAQMLMFAYSSLFAGIAVFSHTINFYQAYYRCGPTNGSVDAYDRLCTKLFNYTEDKLYNPELVHRDISIYLRDGLIQHTRHLKNKRLYVYTGLRNVLFSPRQSLSVVQIFTPYIGSTEPILTRVQDANLVMPTNSRSFGGECTELSENSFFIGKCGFSGVTEAINFLLFNHLNTSSEAYRQYNTPRGKVSTFDQREFTRDLGIHDMDDFGYYYIPRKCNYQYCYLHFYFHGCLSGRHVANETHVENTGLLELAERKGFIVIFPQANRSLSPENEIGCWDTFGTTGELYATNRGAQITAVKRMLDRLLGLTKPPSKPSYWDFPTSSGAVKGRESTPNRGNGNKGYSIPNHQHRYSSYFGSKRPYGR